MKWLGFGFWIVRCLLRLDDGVVVRGVRVLSGAAFSTAGFPHWLLRVELCRRKAGRCFFRRCNVEIKEKAKSNGVGLQARALAGIFLYEIMYEEKHG